MASIQTLNDVNGYLQYDGTKYPFLASKLYRLPGEYNYAFHHYDTDILELEVYLKTTIPNCYPGGIVEFKLHDHSKDIVGRAIIRKIEHEIDILAMAKYVLQATEIAHIPPSNEQISPVTVSLEGMKAAIKSKPAIPPSNPIYGQMWSDPVTQTPLVWDGYSWLSIGAFQASVAAQKATTPPITAPTKSQNSPPIFGETDRKLEI